MQDLRYALRTLRRQPVFAAVAVLTLALGIGANSAIFSVLYQVLLRPLPYREPSRLVFVWNSGKDGERTHVSIPDYLDRRAQAPAIEDATLLTTRNVTISTSGRPEQLVSLAVTPSFFATLGRGPQIGRAFATEDAVPGADGAVILTHALWRSHFGADEAIVGHTLQVNGESRVILGVLPADFELPVRDVSLLMPFAFTPAQMSDAERGNEFSLMIARLRPDASVQQLNAQMQAIVARLIDRLPARAAFMRTSGFTGVAVPIRDQLAGNMRGPLYLLQAGVLLVLLIACANVANLLLMRASGRSRELAIRSTLGAHPWRIGRQLLVEGLVLAAFGAAGGIALAALGIRALAATVAQQVPGASAASIDLAALGFTAAISLLTGAVCGLAPTLSLVRGAPSSALKEDATRSSSSQVTRRLRGVIVAGEVALAVMLLAAAGLLIKSFARVLQVDPGFSTDHVLSAQVALPGNRYPDADALRGFWSRLLTRAAVIPGVTHVGLTGAVPFSGQEGSGTYRLLDRSPAPSEKPPHAFLHTVGGDYFNAMRIPLRAGRVFTPGDTASAPRVVVIDEFLAARRFPGVDPIGRQLNFGSPRNYTIVGVVGTVNETDLAVPVAEERIYFTVAQVAQDSMAIVLKGAVDPASLAAQLRAAVQAVDAEQAIAEVRTLDDWRARSLQPRRAPAALLALFGILAVTLAAIGIYGVIAFGVAERVREFGIRQALGADRAAILSLVLKQGLRTSLAGVVAGVAGALAFTRYLRSLLFGVSAHDVGILAGASVLLLGVAVLAAYIPARRATRIDPMAALRA